MSPAVCFIPTCRDGGENRGAARFRGWMYSQNWRERPKHRTARARI